MVIVAFKPGEKEISKYEELDQYDYGQILRIQGLKLPSAVEIHFALQKTGGTSKTRIGITEDGVTDVPIPDSMLENEDETKDYDIYAFVYITDETSGQTEYRITLKVKARPKPEVPGGGDNPDIFHEAVEAVREAMKAAAESEKQAEGWAHGREDLPERAEDNAKYYAGKAHEDAEQTATDKKEVERLVESVSGIEEQVEKVDELTKQAQKAATDAGLHKEAAENARKGAETAKTEAETAAGKTAEDKTAVETAKGEVLKAQEAVSTDRKAVESIKTGIEQLGGEITGTVEQGMQELGAAKQQAVQAIEQTGTAQKSAVEASGAKALQSIENIKQTAEEAVETAKFEAVQAIQAEGTTQTGAVTAEGEKQVQAVRGAAQEIVEDRGQIQENKTGIAKLKEDITTQMEAKLDKNQGAENAGKALVVGEDGNVTPSDKPAIPTKLPNPYKLTFDGAVTAEYDGSGAVTVTIPRSGATERIEKLASDITVELEPNKLYIFPEMENLTYTLKESEDKNIVNEYHFIFTSGASPVQVVHPLGVRIGNFTVLANKVYEVSIMENLLTSQNWEV